MDLMSFSSVTTACRRCSRHDFVSLAIIVLVAAGAESFGATAAAGATGIVGEDAGEGCGADTATNCGGCGAGVGCSSDIRNRVPAPESRGAAGANSEVLFTATAFDTPALELEVRFGEVAEA